MSGNPSSSLPRLPPTSSILSEPPRGRAHFYEQNHYVAAGQAPLAAPVYGKKRIDSERSLRGQAPPSLNRIRRLSRYPEEKFPPLSPQLSRPLSSHHRSFSFDNTRGEKLPFAEHTSNKQWTHSTLTPYESLSPHTTRSIRSWEGEERQNRSGVHPFTQRQVTRPPSFFHNLQGPFLNNSHVPHPPLPSEVAGMPAAPFNQEARFVPRGHKNADHRPMIQNGSTLTPSHHTSPPDYSPCDRQTASLTYPHQPHGSLTGASVTQKSPRSSPQDVNHYLAYSPPRSIDYRELDGGALGHSFDKSKKRLRISRACQHCKTRKTRCDAIGALPGDPAYPRDALFKQRAEQEENDEREATTSTTKPDMVVVQPCTNCLRSGIECFYSQRQLKRGPSKGYLKDLERRLDSLENHLGGGGFSAAQHSDEERGVHNQEKPEERLQRLESALSTKWSPEDSPEESLTESKEDMTLGSRPTERQVHEIAISTSEEPTISDVIDKERAQEYNARTLAIMESDASEAIARMENTYRSTCLNATVPVLAYQNTLSDRLEPRFVWRRLQWAIRLLVDPVRSKETLFSSRSTSPHPDTYKSNGAMWSRNTQGQKLEALVGQATVGFGESVQAQFDQDNGSLFDFDALRMKRKVDLDQCGLEADILLLCYLHSIRVGLPSGGPVLAAAAAKLCAHGRDSRNLRSRLLAMALDQWHNAAFRSSKIYSGPLSPLSMPPREVLDIFAEESADSPLPGCAVEFVRGALMMGLLTDAAAAYDGNWDKVTSADVEAIIYCTGAQDARKTEDTVDLCSSHAMRPVLQATLRLFHSLQLLPVMEQVASASRLEDVLKLTQAVLSINAEQYVIDSKDMMLKSFIGPHVTSIAAVALAWLSRALAYISARDHFAGGGESSMEHQTSSEQMRSRLLTLGHYRSKIYDLSCLLSRTTLLSGGDVDEPGSLRPVFLRISLFCRHTVTHTTKIGKLLEASDTESLEKSREDQGGLGLLSREVNSLSKAICELGPLGLILSSTSQEEAWSLLP